MTTILWEIGIGVLILCGVILLPEISMVVLMVYAFLVLASFVFSKY